MTVVTLMAQALFHELQDRRLYAVTLPDCEAIMRTVIERSGKIAASLPEKERGEALK